MSAVDVALSAKPGKVLKTVDAGLDMLSTCDANALKKAVVTTATQGADASAKSSLYSRQQTNKSGQSPGAGSGISVVDTMKGFQENLTAFDKTGKKVFLTMQQAFGTFNEEG